MGKNSRGKPANRSVRIQKFWRKFAQHTLVGRHHPVIAPRQRPGPRLMRPQLLVMIQDLARQRKQRAQRFTARQPGVLQNLHAGLFQRKHQSRSECSGRVVRHLVFPPDAYRHAAQRPRNRARHAHRCRIAFYPKHLSFQRRNAQPVKRLQRMHGANRGSAFPNRLQPAGIARPAGV